MLGTARAAQKHHMPVPKSLRCGSSTPGFCCSGGPSQGEVICPQGCWQEAEGRVWGLHTKMQTLVLSSPSKITNMRHSKPRQGSRQGNDTSVAEVGSRGTEKEGNRQ